MRRQRVKNGSDGQMLDHSLLLIWIQWPIKWNRSNGLIVDPPMLLCLSCNPLPCLIPSAFVHLLFSTTNFAVSLSFLQLIIFGKFLLPVWGTCSTNHKNRYSTFPWRSSSSSSITVTHITKLNNLFFSFWQVSESESTCEAYLSLTWPRELVAPWGLYAPHRTHLLVTPPMPPASQPPKFHYKCFFFLTLDAFYVISYERY